MGNPFAILLHAWHPSSERWFFRDVVVNVGIYIPLGFAAHLVLRKSRLPLFDLYGPVLLGLLLSTAMELTQLFVPTRETSLIDLVTNVFGSALGVVLAIVFGKLAEPLPRRSPSVPIDRSALLLVFCWTAWLLFPFFPVVGAYALMRKLSLLAGSPLFAPVPFVSAAALWYAVGLLLPPAGIPYPRVLLGLSILVVPAQLLIVDRQPEPSMFLGAVAGFLLFAWRPRAWPVTKTEAWAFSAVLLFRGLSPFHFVPHSTAFTWIPFGGVLNAEWQYAGQVLLEKMSWYATAIWLLRAAGMRMLYSILLVAALLAAIEAAQTCLPGRTSEITDPLQAILMGFVLFILSREKGTRSQSAG